MTASTSRRRISFESIIGLVPNLFYGTGIPASILVLNRDKPAVRKGKRSWGMTSSRRHSAGRAEAALSSGLRNPRKEAPGC